MGNLTKCLFIVFISTIQFQAIAQIKATALGTGQSTGHIATLRFTNEGCDAHMFQISANSQISDFSLDGVPALNSPEPNSWFYIPTGNVYQNYIATKVAFADSIQTGTKVMEQGDTVVVFIHGYCDNVFLPPFPSDVPLPIHGSWIGSDGTFKDNMSFERVRVDSKKAARKNPYQSANIPGFEESGGQISAGDGAIELKAVALINGLKAVKDSYRKKDAGEHMFPDKTDDEIIQQSFWLYSATISEAQYTETHFARFMEDQCLDQVAAFTKMDRHTISDYLAPGVEHYWHQFESIALSAGCIQRNPDFDSKSEEVILKVDSAGSAIDYSKESVARLAENSDPLISSDDSIWAMLKFTQSDAKSGTKANFWFWPAASATALGMGLLSIDHFAKSSEKIEDSEPVSPVEPAVCDFQFNLVRTNSLCEQNTGTLFLRDLNHSDAKFEWSNGANTPAAVNLSGGEYSVIVKYNEGQCTDTLHFELEEIYVEFNLNAQAIPPSCTFNGDLLVSYTTFPDLDVAVNIALPNVSQPLLLINPPSTFSIRNYFYNQSIGVAEITVHPVGTADVCSESIDVEIELGRKSTFFLSEETSPPSSPTATDGMIVIDLLVAYKPWTLFVNGEALISGSEDQTTIENLGNGIYVIEVMDALGCMTQPITIEFNVVERPQRFEIFAGLTARAAAENWPNRELPGLDSGTSYGITVMTNLIHSDHFKAGPCMSFFPMDNEFTTGLALGLALKKNAPVIGINLGFSPWLPRAFAWDAHLSIPLKRLKR